MFLRDIGVIPGTRSVGRRGDAAASITNLSRRGFVAGSGLFVIGIALAGCSTYIEPDIDANAFDLAACRAKSADRGCRRRCHPCAVDRDP